MITTGIPNASKWAPFLRCVLHHLLLSFSIASGELLLPVSPCFLLCAWLPGSWCQSVLVLRVSPLRLSCHFRLPPRSFYCYAAPAFLTCGSSSCVCFRVSRNLAFAKFAGCPVSLAFLAALPVLLQVLSELCGSSVWTPDLYWVRVTFIFHKRTWRHDRESSKFHNIDQTCAKNTQKHHQPRRDHGCLRRRWTRCWTSNLRLHQNAETNRKSKAVRNCR